MRPENPAAERVTPNQRKILSINTRIYNFMSEQFLLEQAQSLWETAKQSMREIISHETFSAWFSGIECTGSAENILQLGVGSDFSADWIRDNYSDIIRKHICLAAGANVDFKIISTRQEQSLDEEIENTRIHRVPSSKPVNVAPPLIHPRNTFENFVVGESNNLAHASALAVANAPGMAYNPLCFYGSTGLGKTHLMHAVAHFVFKNNPNYRIVYISSERFVNEYIRAIQDKELAKFRDRYRNVDVLMVDDIQFFAGKERCQEEFFHAFNDLFFSGKQIVLSADRPASEIKDLEDRLVSRFDWGMPIDIQPPDYETRMAILSKKAETLSADIPAEVIDLLARKITKNVRRMEGALNRLKGYISLVAQGGRKLDVALAEQLLSDTFLQEETDEQISIDFIQKKASEYFKVDLVEMLGPRRPANIALARQIAMYLSRKLTSHSLQEIGQRFGGRNHGTVMHAISTVSDTMAQDENLRRSVEYLIKTISGMR